MTDRKSSRFAARIYYLHPLLAGPFDRWDEHLDRCVALGFDHLLIAPPFVAGRNGNLFVAADHDRVHPALAYEGDAVSLLIALAEKCRRRGLSLLLDVAADRIAAEAPLVQAQPGWFRTGVPSLDPRREAVALEAAEFSYDTPAAAAIADWWKQRFNIWIAAGVSGFRCLGLRQAPATFWESLIPLVRAQHPDVRFIAWTPGLAWQKVEALASCGFDAMCSSASWWNYRDAWFAREHAQLRRCTDSILTFPESPFDARLAGGMAPVDLRRRSVRRALRFSAAVGDSWLMPMGFEFGARDALHPARGSPEEFARLNVNARDSLADEIKAANNVIVDLSRSQGGGVALHTLSAPDSPVAVMLRATGSGDPRRSARATLMLINADLNATQPLPRSDILAAAGGRLSRWRTLMKKSIDVAVALEPGEVRLLVAETEKPVVSTAAARSKRAISEAMKVPRIAIENLTPAVDGGLFPLRRVAGEAVQVSADIFTDGHEQLAAVLQWRAADQREWQEVPMRTLGNDRWTAAFAPSRLGRHEFTVLAWLDLYGSFRGGLAKKHAAGLDLKLEVAEGLLLLSKIAAQGEGDTTAIKSLVEESAGMAPAKQLEMLLAETTLDAVVATRYRPFALQRTPVIPLEAERLAARHASWYELFPRSETDDAAIHGSFDDVIQRLPAIRDMGFDVLYFPPIHPIGKTNRKGRNNSLKATADDPGSPYAIGSPDGGHEAIHPQLGTFEDFRRLSAAAAENGLELALDFAIQCSPDHPWLKTHPGWFAWRPDGSMKYAENPPKKYEDIVNVDFYAESAMPGLWLALRDIVLLWVSEGVKIFRVDNPHTKPLPFWEWLIADVRGRDPEVIFLAEAFTRPTMMARLGKIGFSQSYTYFTWRNGKQEIGEYLTELNTAPLSEFYRPHFFVNTPDINPYFLQGSGRAGFLIRAALATMGSGLWGMYSGFELCESAALPGKEEYLDSEKYEIRPRDWKQPGNIVAEITQLNRIRRENPVLQTHLGLKLYDAGNDRIVYFGKASADRRNFILIAISLDPHQAQEADFELPLWELGLPDDAALQGEDLMNGHRWTWHGKHQHLRIEPWNLPFGIWRVTA